jgi:hypothetical protein
MLGIYLSDLVFTAQLPLQIKAATGTELLVNFSRHRITAGIMKRLLQMIELSRRYTLEPEDGACERCLWIACLSEEELMRCTIELEMD